MSETCDERFERIMRDKARVERELGETARTCTKLRAELEAANKRIREVQSNNRGVREMLRRSNRQRDEEAKAAREVQPLLDSIVAVYECTKPEELWDLWQNRDRLMREYAKLARSESKGGE